MAPSDWQTYRPDSTPEPEPSASKPRPARPTARQARKARSVQPGLVIAGVVSALVVGLVAFVIVEVVDSETVSEGESALEPDGFANLVKALEEETGSTTVFEASIFTAHASIDVPFKAGDPREVSYRWDGDNLLESTKGTSDQTPFDLADLDAALFQGMCAEAKALVEDSKDCYLIIRAPDSETDKGWISAHSSNEFSQGGYIAYDRDGNEVSRTTW